MYVRSPGSGSCTKRPHTLNEDFFATLASSIIKTQNQKDKKLDNADRYQS
jgi:hypothetical protein